MSPQLPDQLVSVGVDVIDEQHEVLLRMYSDIEQARTIGAPEGLVVERLADFHQFARIHFATEESLLAEHVPERLAPHRRVHEYLLERLRTAIVRYRRDGGPVPESLVRLVREFVVDHTQETDTRDLAHVSERVRRPDRPDPKPQEHHHATRPSR